MRSECKNSVILGFDFGYRRIGVAIGNRLTFQARPLFTLLAKQGIPQWIQVDQLIKTWQPEALVVGLPTHIDGSEQYTTHAARTFSQTLSERYHLPTHMVDERLTTVEARAALFAQGGYKKIKQTEVDSVAACIILEQWLQTSH